MPPPAPSFPAFETWQTMSESEQDALLARMETAKQRGALVRCLSAGAVLIAGAVVVGWLLLAP
jgi:hypothetical protein